MDSAILASRRARFMEQIGDGVCVLPGPHEALRSGDVHYRFRQDSDLLYLTGFEEPDTVAVFAPNHPRTRFVLFVRPRDPAAETWIGRRAGVEGAVERFGADAAYPLGDLEGMLPGLIEGNEALWYPLGRDRIFDGRITDCLNDLRARVRAGVAAPERIVDPRAILHEMRLFKAPEEIGLMRRAAEITREAHLAGLAAIRPGAMEYEVEAAIEYTFRRRGAEGPGYPTVVGSGPNATILHYISNNREIRPGDLVLVDAGAELDHYSADVTRTYPAGGPYQTPARDVVTAVLAAQAAALDAVKPGARFEAVHQAALRSLVQSMIDLELLSGDPEALIKAEAYRPFYMHRTSHWLGLDVHDVGAYRKEGESRRLEPGMVLTVEPGIYVAPDAEAPERLRGIGVRIEDDVLVTASGHEVLTKAIPKTIDEIEALIPLV